MPFTKKTWVTAEPIPAAELNRIETAIDDILHQDVEVNGEKLFNNSMYIKNAEAVDKGLYIMDGATKAAEILTDSNYAMVVRNLLGGDIRFIDSGGLMDILTLSFNDVVMSRHRARHMRGGADFLPVEPDIIVDVNGHGDFTDIVSAMSAASSGDFIYMRNGTDNTGGYLTIGDGVTLVGQSRNAIIRNQGIIMSNLNARIFGLTLENSGTGQAGPFIDITNDRCVLNGVRIEDANRNTIGVGSSVDETRIQNCWINRTGMNTSPTYPILIGSGTRTCIVENNVIWAPYDFDDLIYVEGQGHIIANNILHGTLTPGVVGITLDGTGNKAIGNFIETTYQGGDVSGQYCLMQGNYGASNLVVGFTDSGGPGNLVGKNKVA